MLAHLQKRALFGILCLVILTAGMEEAEGREVPTEWEAVEGPCSMFRDCNNPDGLPRYSSHNDSNLVHKPDVAERVMMKRKRWRCLGDLHEASRVDENQRDLLLQTAWKVGKDGIEAGTNLVPDSVPRPVARIAVSIVAVTVALFVLNSFLSTAFFVLGTMGLAYFIFLALNKDEGPRGGGGTKASDDPVEEARRIMDKYK